MRVYVYTGPTLPVAQGKKLLDAHFLPPIKHGDILDALSEGVECIAIIDGYYETTAATRHKEILQALEAGVYVLGSSSLGALRAAELNAFGMEGIGEIYGMYNSGLIDGDDEVAVKHAPESEDFKLLSLPLAELRYNLQSMLNNSEIDASTMALIINCAKHMYFGQRTLKRILAAAAQQGLTTEIIDHCRNYLTYHWHDLKRADAQLMLNIINDRINGEALWPTFSRLSAYKTDLLYRWNREQLRVKTELGFIREHEVVAQVNFTTNEYPKARQEANECAWLKDYAQRLDIKVSATEIEAQREQFWQQEQITDNNDEIIWLAERMISTAQLIDRLETAVYLKKLAQDRAQNSIQETHTRAQLLLEYAYFRKISANIEAIEVEWQKSYLELNKSILSADQIGSHPVINLAITPAKQPLTVPDRINWCKDNRIDITQLDSWLAKRAILRKFATNFYFKPAIINRELVTTEFKFRGVFHKVLNELLAIYQSIAQSNISTTLHPQWKVFVQPDIRAILVWFCKQHQIHPSCMQNYLSWKGFDDFNHFFDIAQLNYIYLTQLNGK